MQESNKVHGIDLYRIPFRGLFQSYLNFEFEFYPTLIESKLDVEKKKYETFKSILDQYVYYEYCPDMNIARMQYARE